MLDLLIRFWRDRTGNYALLTSVLVLPLLLGTGTAVDYANVSRHHRELQSAVDAAVLAVAHEGTDASADEAETIARQYLAGNSSLEPRLLKLGRVDGKVSLRVEAETSLAFGALLGHERWPVIADATADIAYLKYEIGLVLDTTGSMAGGKLIAMKDAVNSMVDTMSKQVKDKEALKYALVPFANFVNVGPQYGPTFKKDGKLLKGTGADWLDLKGKAEFAQLDLPRGLSRFEVFHRIGEDWKGCVETRYPKGKKQHDVLDTTPAKSDANSLFVPAFSIDEPSDPGYTNDYIASDVKPLDKSATGKAKKLLKYGVLDLLEDVVLELPLVGISPEPVLAGGRGPNKDCLTQPILPLTNNYEEIRKRVDALQANGTTNITEGVAWGTRVLSPGEPFTEGSPSNKSDVMKIMIVLTDGANVFGNTGNDLGSTYGSNGYLVDGRLGITVGSSGDTNARMNAQTLAACEGAKKDGLEVYTIRLEEPDVKTGNVLKECASTPDHFFDVPTRAKLDEAFGEIGRKIVRLRLAT